MRLPQPIRTLYYRLARTTARSMLHAVAKGWFNGVFYHRTLSGRKPRQLEFSAQNPWPGDAKRGAELFRGEFCFAGHVETAPDALWRPKTAPDEWIAALHGFDWLADLHAVGGEAARARARELVESWIKTESRWRARTWRPDVTAARLINWLGHAEFLFAGTEGELAARWLDHVARQGRHLRRVAPLLDSGFERLLVIKALIYAGICLPSEARRLAKWMALLTTEIELQIAHDGGHVSRSPAVHFAVFRHLVDLRIAPGFVGDGGAAAGAPVEFQGLQLQRGLHGGGGERAAPDQDLAKLRDGADSRIGHPPLEPERLVDLVVGGESPVHQDPSEHQGPRVRRLALRTTAEGLLLDLQQAVHVGLAQVAAGDEKRAQRAGWISFLRENAVVQLFSRDESLSQRDSSDQEIAPTFRHSAGL